MRVREFVDARTPRVARLYRTIRDSRHDYGAPVATPWGFTLRGDKDLADSRLESHEAQVFLDHLADADHTIDVGANVGLFTLLAASKGAPVTAVEPSQANVEVLCRNLHENRLHAEVLPVALSRQTGVGELFGGGQGASLVRGWGGMQSTYSRLVPTCTLDGLFAKRFRNERLLIKVDAEGAEPDILDGGLDLLQASPAPTWIVEIGLTENFANGINPQFVETFERFWSNGYQTHAVEANVSVTESEVREWAERGRRPFWTINYLFTKPRPAGSNHLNL